MKVIKINEEQYRKLMEDVFISDFNSKNGKRHATLSYTKNNSYATKKRTYNKNNKMPADYIKTDLMDVNNGQTYEKMLKGGVIAYNITDIKGEAVMHYFKHYFDKKKQTVKYGNKTWELEMADDEFRNFMKQFVTKVNCVINDRLNDFKKEDPSIKSFPKVVICPVPSSARFAEEMAKRMVHFKFADAQKTEVAKKDLFLKDLSYLEKDEDFLEKNKEKYDEKFSDSKSVPGTAMQYVDKYYNRFTSQKISYRYIDEANAACDELLRMMYQRKAYKDEKKFAERITELYVRYYESLQAIMIASEYYDPTLGKMTKRHSVDLIKQIKSSKPHAIERRSEYIWSIVKPLLRGKRDMDGKAYTKIDIIHLEKPQFELKQLPNHVRIGMKNYFTTNPTIGSEYIDYLKDSVFVIFDDNISGATTLSDIIYRCEEMGIKYIIPITFGQMRVKNTYGTISVKDYDGDYNF